MSEAMNNAFDKHFGQKPENPADLRRTDQRVASLEQGARQPRLAMEADVETDKKTRERTEGAAKAAQAMSRDSFFAKRIEDGPKSSSSFSVIVGPPALPCRDDVVVENGAAALSRVSHPWRCAQQQPPVAYSPPAKLLQQQVPPLTTQLFGSARPKRPKIQF